MRVRATCVVALGLAGLLSGATEPAGAAEDLSEKKQPARDQTDPSSLSRRCVQPHVSWPSTLCPTDR